MLTIKRLHSTGVKRGFMNASVRLDTCDQIGTWRYDTYVRDVRCETVDRTHMTQQVRDARKHVISDKPRAAHTWHQTCDARRHMWRQTCHACVALGNIMLRFIEYQNAKKNYFFFATRACAITTRARIQHRVESARKSLINQLNGVHVTITVHAQQKQCIRVT